MTEQEWLSSTDPAAMLAHLKKRASDRKLRLFACACARRMGHVGGIPAIELAEKWADDGYEPPSLSQDWPHPRFEGISWCLYRSAVEAARQWATARSIVSSALRAALLRDIFGNPWRPMELPYTMRTRHEDGLITYVGCPWLTWHDGIIHQLAQAAYDERVERVCDQCRGGKPDLSVLGIPRAFAPACTACHGTGTISDGTLDAGRLAVLADALEEAGADADGELVRHLRGWESCPENYGQGHHSSVGHLSQGPHWHCEKCNGTEWVKTDAAHVHVRGCWAVDLILGLS